MEKPILSPEYQLELHSKVRKIINANPGQELWVTYGECTLQLIPQIDIKTLMATYKGTDADLNFDDEESIWLY